jgi:hypothetical protein
MWAKFALKTTDLLIKTLKYYTMGQNLKKKPYVNVSQKRNDIFLNSEIAKNTLWYDDQTDKIVDHDSIHRKHFGKSIYKTVWEPLGQNKAQFSQLTLIVINKSSQKAVKNVF